MREIKVRAWSESRGMLYDHCLDDLAENLDIDIYLSAGILHIEENGKRLRVMQYTGLKDKNGVEIYEEDIIEFYHKHNLEETSERSQVVWFGDRLGHPAFDLNGFNIKNHHFESNSLSEIVSSGFFHYKVIGNIYEHPELLGDVK